MHLFYDFNNNSDKCMCGRMQGTGKNARCKLNLKDDPDDDGVKVNCYDLTKFAMDGHSVHVGRSPRIALEHILQ